MSVVCVCAGQLTLPQSREAVLEYIIERKRMDDLASSITDGRFREQKVTLSPLHTYTTHMYTYMYAPSTFIHVQYVPVCTYIVHVYYHA